MKRLLLYVHFNKYDHISRHVFYQLEHMRPLFDKLVLFQIVVLVKVKYKSFVINT